MARFVAAWERADFDGIASLLKEEDPRDAAGAPLVQGRRPIIDFLSTVPAGGHVEKIRLITVGANRQPAVTAFIADEEEQGHQFYGVMVFSQHHDAIAGITGFADPALSDHFGLPYWLPRAQGTKE